MSWTDICGVCKEQYNVGERIPRILVNCGHTYCTSCLSKYYRINNPFGDEFFRYGLDKKLYCLDSGVEKLFLDLSDTSEISFQGFDPNLNYTVNINRKLVPNSDILEFSLLSGNPTTKYRFKKGVGLIYHHYYRYHY